MSDDDKVRYLDPEQPEFIEQLEGLLQRAREGETIGCTLFEFTSEGDLYSECLGFPPDYRSIIGELSAYSAEVANIAALEAFANAINEEGAGE